MQPLFIFVPADQQKAPLLTKEGWRPLRLTGWSSLCGNPHVSKGEIVRLLVSIPGRDRAAYKCLFVVLRMSPLLSCGLPHEVRPAVAFGRRLVWLHS
jgi:hypothetical protein